MRKWPDPIHRKFMELRKRDPTLSRREAREAARLEVWYSKIEFTR